MHLSICLKLRFPIDEGACVFISRTVLVIRVRSMGANRPSCEVHVLCIIVVACSRVSRSRHVSVTQNPEWDNEQCNA